ncbi:MAG TPA: S8 family peptidase, partial [Pyrinomonadaceae bacterium]
MKSIWICFLALSIFALALLPMSTLSQSTIGDRIFYPPEFSPLNTASSPLTTTSQSTQESLILATKFVKVQDAIPNRYIVVLNDDVVASDAELKDREAAINAIAESHAKDYDGKVGFVYETALKGYSIELKDEAAAIAISEDAQVLWVEEVGRIQLTQNEPEAFQTNPPWGLDAIDGSVPVGPVAINGTTNGIYVYNATGAGVTAYVLDSGLRRTHQEFGVPPFVSRASIAADFIAGSPYLDSCIFPKPNASDNDCSGHGTHVAGTLGGTTYGVAKGVTILSVKVCTANFYGCPTDVLNAGINWVTNHHNANPSSPAVANMSISGLGSLSMDTAVQNSINAGVTYAVAAGNANNDARFYSPARVAAALTVGSIDALASRVLSCNPGSGSNFGGRVDLFAPGSYVLSAWSGSDTQSVINCGTSMASPHVAGAVALYLQGRSGTNRCAAYPIQGPASPLGAPISTCPDRVARFIASNANLNKLTNVNGVDSNGVPV